MTNEELKYFETFVDRYQNDPVAWCYDILDCEKLEWYQIEALEKLCNDRFVSMACGGGIGKTFILNVCALWFLTTHPGCNIIATAPTDKQLKSALWKELVIWIKKSRGGILKQLLDWNQDKIWVRGSKEDWFILARTASKDGSSDVSEALSGIHSDYGVLFLVDEASGVPEAVFGAIEGSFTSPNSFCILASNPTRSVGSFHASHHQESDLWHQIQVSSKDSARVDNEYINRMKVRFGENSPVYRAKVEGIFPRDFGEEMSIFGEELKNMVSRTIDEENPKLIVIGLDIARYGSDQTVMITREGYNVFDIQNTARKDLFQTTEWAWQHIKNFRARFPDYPIEVNIDATGLGAGVADNLKHYAKSYNRESKDKVLIRIHPVENVQKSEDPQFFNLRAESFFNAQRMMANCTFAPGLNVDPIIKDLSSIDQKIHPSSQKIMVESKDEIKKKNYGVSPDFGDALILCLNNFSGKNYDAVRKKLIEEANLSKRKMLTKNSTFGSGVQKLSSTRWS